MSANAKTKKLHPPVVASKKPRAAEALLYVHILLRQIIVKFEIKNQIQLTKIENEFIYFSENRVTGAYHR